MEGCGWSQSPLAAVQGELFSLILREIASPDEEAANLATDVVLFLMGEMSSWSLASLAFFENF